jgi:hypothetical protein
MLLVIDIRERRVVADMVATGPGGDESSAPSRMMGARKRPTPSYGVGRIIGLELGRRLKA